jgi:uncharacterized protein (DUF1800 family)
MKKQAGPWAPFEPTARDPWDLAKVAHLHRRAAFGATRADLLRDLKVGPQASMDRLFRPAEPTTDDKEAFAALRGGAIASGDAERLKAFWLYCMLYGKDPLREKLTLFWHGHFATSLRKVGNVGFMLTQNELFRQHALGNFAELLTGIITDPAMLIWLDGASSNKKRPNENFAREFLELFTVGVGHYTEKDIREAARAFTGWGRSGNQQFGEAPAFRFDPAQFDDGCKTFLGQTGAWKPADIVRITLEQPACAEFLCRKLYKFLVNEAQDPPADVLKPLAQEFRSSKYSIRHVVEVILRSRHFYSKAAIRQRIKSPVEYSAGLVRLLEPAERSDIPLLAVAVACDRQGQEMFAPPNVKGWDGGRTWVNSTTVLERGNWASHLVWGNEELGIKPFDPLAWGKKYGLTAEKVGDALVELTLQGDISPEVLGLVRKAASTGTADGLRKALQRLLQCPEFQLA